MRIRLGLALLGLILILPGAAARVLEDVTTDCQQPPPDAMLTLPVIGPCGDPRGTEGVIRNSAILRPLERTAVDDVLDLFRATDLTQASSARNSLHEGTTLNAIALSRASGVPLGPDDITQRHASSTMTASWRNFLIPDADDIINILTLGVGPVAATGFDVSFAGSSSAQHTSDTTPFLPDETSMSGIALIGAGIPLDPHMLISSVDSSARASGVTTFPRPSIPPAGADLAAQAAIAPIRTPPIPSFFAFSNRSIEHQFALAGEHLVELPDDLAFAGIAAARNGIPFAAEDALNIVTTKRETESDDNVQFIERDVLLYWITLGLTFAIPE